MTTKVAAPPLRLRFGIALVAASTTAASLYAVIRLMQVMRFNEPDPALIIWSEHAGYFWRSWTAAYGGGMIGFVAYLTAGRDIARTTRAVSASVIVAAILITAQGLVLP